MSESGTNRILIVDDDRYRMANEVEELEILGFQVQLVDSASEALAQIRTSQYDAVVLDIRLKHGDELSAFETSGGTRTGIALAKRIIALRPRTKILFFSCVDEPQIPSSLKATSNYAGCWHKSRIRSDEFAQRLQRVLHSSRIRQCRTFIVHGHDHPLLLELKNLLQNTLQMMPPIILSEQPSRGMTVIEKFEHYAKDIDVAFILMTLDDVGKAKNDLGPPEMRARQNVLFEFGYFLGSLKRMSGRVVLLYQHGVNIPTDLTGITYVDISDGIARAAEQIRRELSEFQ